MRSLVIALALAVAGAAPAHADGKGWYARLSTGLLLGPAPDFATAEAYCQTTRDPDCRISQHPDGDASARPRRPAAAPAGAAGTPSAGLTGQAGAGQAGMGSGMAGAGEMTGPKLPPREGALLDGPAAKLPRKPVVMVVPPLETYGPPLPAAADGETDDDPSRLGPALPGVYHPKKIYAMGEAAAAEGRPKFAAVTVDDGPDPATTPEILDILARNGVKATFFLVGNQVRRYPELVQAILAGGHEIGNHSRTHPILAGMGEAAVREELTANNALIEGAGAPRPVWFRPPYGSYDTTVVEEAQSLGMSTILWTVDPRDWRKPDVAVLRQRIAEGTHPGAVILLHDHKANTVTALPDIIKDLRVGGYRLVTISEWRRLSEPPRVAGLK